MGGEDASRDKHNPSSSPNRRYPEKQEDPKLWGILLFGLIGATVTTFAVGQLRRTVDWFFSELSRSQSGKSGKSFRTAFQEEAWRRHNRRMQEEYEDEMERLERIRRMQSVFNRERNKYKRTYEGWRESGGDPDPGRFHQHFQREDWYWKTESSYQNQRTNYRETPRATAASSSLSHHYSVLGLDRSRRTPYTGTEIKKAFRTKAKEFHPDQNQTNKEVAEARFKEVMTSYEAIKQERKDIKF